MEKRDSRIDRIESTLTIQQLPVRYAMAVDGAAMARGTSYGAMKSTGMPPRRSRVPAVRISASGRVRPYRRPDCPARFRPGRFIWKSRAPTPSNGARGFRLINGGMR